METPLIAAGRTEHDPALLAFIKCHLTSFVRWDALRVLAETPGRWSDAADVARATHKPLAAVTAALEELSREELVERSDGPDGAVYRLEPLDPTCRVMTRLVDEARQSHELRQLIVARVVANGAVSRHSRLQRMGT